MKKIFFLPGLMVWASLNAQIKVPAVVSAAFTKQFPAANKVKWGKENAKEYEAEFELNGKKISANYDMQGNWKETETEIPVSDLPGAVAKSIQAKYPGAVISGADKTEQPSGKIIYEANIKIKGKKRELEFFPDGRPAK
jgi:hypothetical protein